MGGESLPVRAASKTGYRSSPTLPTSLAYFLRSAFTVVEFGDISASINLL